ncbi:MAG TPA: HAD family hydrolase [Candidatus Binatia bacterium]|nr:HAD family hydrolase [Candidatus Binatia bacterium]
MARYRGVLFDLFGTLVHFDDARLPTIALDGRDVRSTVPLLAPLLGDVLPAVSPALLHRTLRAVSEEMMRARTDDHIEHPSRERFRRVLLQLGCDDVACGETAAMLSRVHMRAIADATVFPPEHEALLAGVRAAHRTGVVSNFDDTAAAYSILARHGILGSVDTVVISEAVGMRKPHPALVREGLRGIGLAADEVLFVGDTFDEDMAAAHAAGVDAVWIDRAGRGVPVGVISPRWVVRTLPELAALLER